MPSHHPGNRPDNVRHLGSPESPSHVVCGTCPGGNSLISLGRHGEPRAAWLAPPVEGGKRRAAGRGRESGEGRRHDPDGVQPHGGGDYWKIRIFTKDWDPTLTKVRLIAWNTISMNVSGRARKTHSTSMWGRGLIWRPSKSPVHGS